MKVAHGLMALAAFACAGVVLWWGVSSQPPVPEHVDPNQGDAAETDQVGMPGVASNEAKPELASLDAETQTRAVTSAFQPQERSSDTMDVDVPADPGLSSRIPWPVKSSGDTADTGAVASVEPVVPVRLAFRALWYLGVDPEAERTWSRAINDPNSPPGVRSDLIEDMIDEGYTDNNNPTKADLPVILARLEIIERYAPYAMDQVNADAFEEIYEGLLDLYIRLGGEPRDGR